MKELITQSMSTGSISAAAYKDTKPHYEILDGLRGVAAFIVIIYHVFECFSSTPLPHGYLTVDFFFVLSGFVIGYAYDNRWDKMTTGGFFRRRLIRLHPMVIMGCIIGVITFLIQGSVKWDGSSVGLSLVMLAMLSTMFMIPSAAGLPTEIRGNSEMFPVNGPYWSLFFEYIGNILYALFLRKISTKILGCIAVVSGVLLAYISISQGQLGIGWTLADYGFWGGLIRMLFPYSIGMFMARVFRPMQIKGAFWKCGLILVVIALLPIVSTEGIPWLTGAYDAFCVLFIFPALVWMGASELKIGKQTTDVCRFVGDLSYPLYTIHYPFMYLFYAYIGFNGESSVLTIKETWPEAIALVIGCLVLAWLCMKFYDLPVRRWLTKKYLYDK